MTYDAYFESLVIEVMNSVRWFINQGLIPTCYQLRYITTYASILKTFTIGSGILTMVLKQCQKVQRTGQRTVGLFMKTIGLLRFLK